MPEFYHNLVTQKSFELLKQLQKEYKFILIGGWAVFLWSGALKSKDIDIVVDYHELEKFKQNFELSKNERLKKYEAKVEEIDIDIYVHHYSNLGIPVEELAHYEVNIKGFCVPKPEILLILKQCAHKERSGTPKGEKDKIDIFSLLMLTDFNFDLYKTALAKFQSKQTLEELKKLLKETSEIPELNLNQHKYSRFKKKLSKNLLGDN